MVLPAHSQSHHCYRQLIIVKGGFLSKVRQDRYGRNRAGAVWGRETGRLQVTQATAPLLDSAEFMNCEDGLVGFRDVNFGGSSNVISSKMEVRHPPTLQKQFARVGTISYIAIMLCIKRKI
jgi:hypothetical protein